MVSKKMLGYIGLISSLMHCVEGMTEGQEIQDGGGELTIVAGMNAPESIEGRPQNPTDQHTPTKLHVKRSFTVRDPSRSSINNEQHDNGPVEVIIGDDASLVDPRLAALAKNASRVSIHIDPNDPLPSSPSLSIHRRDTETGDSPSIKSTEDPRDSKMSNFSLDGESPQPGSGPIQPFSGIRLSIKKPAPETWYGKICKAFTDCFSRCKRSNCRQLCAYIFFDNCCVKLVASTSATAGSLYGAYRGAGYTLQCLSAVGGAALWPEIFTGGLMFTVFFFTAQLLLFRLHEGQISKEQVGSSLAHALATSVPAGAIRSWFTLYPMAWESPLLFIPIAAYNLLGGVYFVFGGYQECAREPYSKFGKPLTDGRKLLLDNPFKAVYNAMGRRAQKIERQECNCALECQNCNVCFGCLSSNGCALHCNVVKQTTEETVV